MSDIRQQIKEALFHKTEAEKRLAIEALIQEQVRLARIDEIYHFLDIWHNDDEFGTHNFQDRIKELNNA